MAYDGSYLKLMKKLVKTGSAGPNSIGLSALTGLKKSVYLPIYNLNMHISVRTIRPGGRFYGCNLTFTEF